MVSRSIKRTPTKTIKDCRNRHRTRCRNQYSPLKNTASNVVASINKSISTCHRRLIKIFSKLVRIGTPKRSPRKKGYRALKQVAASDICRSLFAGKPLPPVIPPERKTVFLDLDETLIHSSPEIPPGKFDFVVRPAIDGRRTEFFVAKRPFVDEFLENLSKKYEIVVFTAGIEEYASLVIDKIDRNKVISHRLYRDSCKENDGKFVKDLSELGRDMKRVVLVDDNPNSYEFQPDNAIRIKPFIDDFEDGELKKVMEFLQGCDSFDDMRDAVEQFNLANDDDHLGN
ncbi:uncharacterized protein LOC141700752 [Apium graveolens]|uniref:FCP1 homology domain-containing protein n=1 Tax=Apium graveolens TaxID=4045 RepID=A0A6L5BAT1_APIGR|nr:hypothetical protein AG4045_017914 [Apium graveolens]